MTQPYNHETMKPEGPAYEAYRQKHLQARIAEGPQKGQEGPVWDNWVNTVQGKLGKTAMYTRGYDAALEKLGMTVQASLQSKDKEPGIGDTVAKVLGKKTKQIYDSITQGTGRSGGGYNPYERHSPVRGNI